MNTTKLISFACGILFGTAGIHVLASREAKKVYAHCTAATLRAADDVMTCVNKVKEDAGDIYADALEINAKRAAAGEIIEDEVVEVETAE